MLDCKFLRHSCSLDGFEQFAPESVEDVIWAGDECRQGTVELGDSGTKLPTKFRLSK